MERAKDETPVAGVATLASRHKLSDTAATQLESLLDLVSTDPLAPTTLRDPATILRDHLADSLVALDLDAVRAASTIADLGSGAGFPGLPLAIASPRSTVQLVESNARKCAFIERAVARCQIANARTVHARAETWTEGVGSCDLVTARALAPLEVVAEYAAPLLRPGGALVAWTGGRDPQHEAIAARAAAELGLEAEEPIPVSPYPAVERRHLQLMLKVRETPLRFPRRPGMARKRPLGRA
jgi:16S rRNA (guanine527-N7)-methyltransferase